MTGARAWSRCVAAAAIVILGAFYAHDAAAQSSSARVEVGGGGAFVGGADLGDTSATLTPNTGTPSPFELFRTESKIKPAFGVVGRIGFFITPSLAIEGGLRFTRPTLEIRLSDDVEGAADVTAEETLSEYLFEGSAVWHFGGGVASNGAVPFVFGGASYLRELHEGNALMEESVEYHGGAGVKWWLGQNRRRYGIRVDGGVSLRERSFDLEEGRHAVPFVTGSLIYVF